jgi:phosphopantetheinyl transferase
MPGTTVWLVDGVTRRAMTDTDRAPLRRLLSHVDGGRTTPADWQFATDDDGKPYVVGPSRDMWHFNTSYGDDAVAIAVSRTNDVGVDIQAVAPHGTDEVPWPELTPREQARLRLLPAAERYVEFLRMWTLKEAFTKCLGRGATLAFGSLETSFDPASIVPAAAPDGALLPPIDCHQQEVRTERGVHVLALALAVAGSG